MKPLRVLQIVGKMDRAGAETLLMNLYRRIDRERVQFDFLTHRRETGDYDEEIAALGGRIYRLCPMTAKNLLPYRRQLTALFGEHPEYRIVHSHIDAMSALPLAAAKETGIPVRIAHSHNTAFPRDAKYPLRLLARHFLPQAANRYFACSTAAAEFLFPKGKAETATVLPNAIELERFAFCPDVRKTTRDELGIGKNTLAVGHVGRFCSQKNHDKLIHVFAVLHRQCPDSVLLLVGQGERKERMQTLCAQIGLRDSIRFLGVRNDVERLMQAFDLFLLPSLYEGFPVVGVEAQAAGLPCLFSGRIDRSAALTCAAAFLPLEADDGIWAQRAQELALLPRVDTTVGLTQQGFDIGRQAAFLERFYLAAQEG